MRPDTLLHIARSDDLSAADLSGVYRASSLDDEGFLHCCYPHQLSGVVSRWFGGVDSLVLLSIDPARLNTSLVDENTTGGEELFPHLYGELPLDAVVERMDFTLTSDLRRTLTREN